MILKSIAVKNFRSVLNEKINCDNLTVLVGRNGTGKSSFLRAMEIFYDSKTSIFEEDFYAEDTTQEIEIALTFTDLNDEERSFFSAYLDSNNLTVAKVFSSTNKSGTYHGMRLQNPDFSEVRQAGGKTEIKAKYNEIRTGKYSGLPSVRSAEQVEDELKKWEEANVSSCVKLRDNGQFFGFTGVGQGYLGRYTRFIRIPAVRDASTDATEGKGSCVTQIMDLVVRSVLATRKEFVDLKETAQKKYHEIMDPSNLTELSVLEEQLSGTLQKFAPEANMSLEWAKLSELDFPLPQAEVKLHEDGYKSSVKSTGHGLQRTFILTMLQHLIVAKNADSTKVEIPKEGETKLPGLILAIEEPELYQHPSRQRHMASILLKLAQGNIPGVAKKTQILYTTHSPLFVGLDRFEKIRLLRKADNVDEKPRITKCIKAELNEVAEELWVAGGSQGSKYTGETLKPRLQAVMTPWVNEGFFADVVVLVEGEDDRAAILGMALSLGYDFDSQGISVIPCIGKNNLDRPLVIFRQFGIKTYVIWDSDYGKPKTDPKENRKLLRLLGEPEEDWPNGVKNKYACFKTHLEEVLKEEIGKDKFKDLLSLEQNKLEISVEKDALKNPFVIRQIVEAASKEGKTSITLTEIVKKIAALKK